MKKFNTIVIGSGQAGTPLIFKLASEGKSVAFIEKDKVGGTCLNVGCTPTKTYVASARRIWDAQHDEEMGIEIPSLGRVGMTRKQALAAGHNIKETYRPMSKIARAKEKGETYGFMSAVIDAKTDKILGAVVLGVGGDEVIGSITNVMYADKPFTLIRDSVHLHPTVTELIPTMLEKPKAHEA